MQAVVQSKMYAVHLFGGGVGGGVRMNKKRYASMGDGEWKLVSVLITACLLYLSAVVSANPNDWKSSVPKSSYATSSATNNGDTSQIRHAHYNQQIYSHNHNPQHHHYGSATPAEHASSSSSASAAGNAPPSYASQLNDPQRGLFFADPTSSSLLSTPQEAVIPKPRSLSALPSPTASYYPTTTTTTTTTTATNISDSTTTNSTSSKLKKRRRDQPNKNAGRAIDGATSSTSNAIVATPKKELKPFEGTGRTFLLTPLLAYLVPVFIAQMFGMGMIPAAALITLPIFLLPIGLTAAVFLV